MVFACKIELQWSSWGWKYIRGTLYWGYFIILWLFHLGISCTVVVLTFFCNVCVCVCVYVCVCFGNMCTCIYFILYCLYCVFLYCFVYVYLFLFVLFVLVYGLLPPSDILIAVKSSSTSSSSTSNINHHLFYFLCWVDPVPGHCLPKRGFTITLIPHTTLGRIPLYEWSPRRRRLYMTTHKNHKRQTTVPPIGIRTNNASKRVALDPRLRTRGRRDRRRIHLDFQNFKKKLRCRRE